MNKFDKMAVSSAIAKFKTIISSLKVTFPYLLGLSDNHKEITEEYPDRVSARMPEDLPVRFRGMIKNDITKCSGCRVCSDICPVSCIRIETETGPDKNKSWVAVYDVDASRCIVCGLCVENCPTGSLTHTREYEGSVFGLNEMVASFGRGWATSDLKDKWRKDQGIKEAQEKERLNMQHSPVGSEFRKLLGDKKE